MDLPTSILASLFAALMFTGFNNQFSINYVLTFSNNNQMFGGGFDDYICSRYSMTVESPCPNSNILQVSKICGFTPSTQNARYALHSG